MEEIEDQLGKDQSGEDSPIPFGIRGDTGEFFPALDAASIEAFAAGAPAEIEAQLRPYFALRQTEAAPTRGLVGTIRDSDSLASTGWGAIFGASAGADVREALKLLLDHRCTEVAWDPDAYLRRWRVKSQPLYQEFAGAAAPTAGEAAKAWLWRTGKIALNPVNPRLGVPYYILIVAPPAEISFEFQYSLDLYWAVGRIWFENPDGTPNLDEFRRYAASVVAWESLADSEISTSRQMAVFAPCRPFDEATQAFSRLVAQTIATGADGVPPAGVECDFAIRDFIGPAATKANLTRIWNGEIPGGPPALLFSGGHGVWFPPDKPLDWFPPDQPADNANLQGALVCQDRKPGPIQPDQMFAASDVDSLRPGAMHGMIHFMFACYGGGWPAFDTYTAGQGRTPVSLAGGPRLSRLPQKLLAHPGGGALAVIAHIDKAWGYSFRRGDVPQLQGFSDVIARLMAGDRVGQATDEFNKRWAVLSSELLNELDKSGGKPVNPQLLGNLWIGRDDARNYIVIGDPAVRLRPEAMPILPASDDTSTS